MMDGQSVKTTERGGTRGFDGHKRVKGRKRHILVDTLGLMIANRVEPANVSDRRAGARLLGWLEPSIPADSHAGRGLELADHEAHRSNSMLPIKQSPRPCSRKSLLQSKRLVNRARADADFVLAADSAA